MLHALFVGRGERAVTSDSCPLNCCYIRTSCPVAAYFCSVTARVIHLVILLFIFYHQLPAQNIQHRHFIQLVCCSCWNQSVTRVLSSMMHWIRYFKMTLAQYETSICGRNLESSAEFYPVKSTLIGHFNFLLASATMSCINLTLWHIVRSNRITDWMLSGFTCSIVREPPLGLPSVWAGWWKRREGGGREGGRTAQWWNVIERSESWWSTLDGTSTCLPCGQC